MAYELRNPGVRETKEAGMATRPAWVNRELFPFDLHYVEVGGVVAGE